MISHTNRGFKSHWPDSKKRRDAGSQMEEYVLNRENSSEVLAAQ